MAERSNGTNGLLRLAVGRAEEDPFFLGYALAVYRAVEELDDAGLARRLGCAPVDIAPLALCRRPVSRDASFGDDVRRIAAWANLDADRLVNVLRHAESVAALRQARPRAGGGVLLAARDMVARSEPEPGASADVEPPAVDEGEESRDA